jgi:nucleoside-diphosphate-sugar epimerase
VKVFVTGGTGFIGSHVVAKLRARGDEVRALVRNPAKGAKLEEQGCELVLGDLSDAAAIAEGMEGCDAVIHGAAIYEVGIPRGKRGPMYEANVKGTETVLGAALERKIPKVVYISTVAAFGNTRGRVVDEEYRHPGRDFTSYYEQTKYEAHRAARRLIDEEGLPCVIVQPGGVYGPKDHSQLGNLLNQFMSGRLPAMMFPDAGINLVHVEDVADGVLLALDKGKPGEQYVLGGEVGTMRDFIETAARVSGKRAPRFTIPAPLIRMSAPAGPVIGPLMGFPPNLREMVSTADGVTFWAKHDKAVRELGYSPRPLEEGLRETLAAEGRLPAAA